MRLGFHQFNAHKALVPEGRMSVRSKGALAWRLFPAITTLGYAARVLALATRADANFSEATSPGVHSAASLVRRRLPPPPYRRFTASRGAGWRVRAQKGGSRFPAGGSTVARIFPRKTLKRWNPRPEFRRLRSFRPWGWPPRKLDSRAGAAKPDGIAAAPRPWLDSRPEIPAQGYENMESAHRKREAPEASAPSDAY